ncbi:MAG: uroporphyrinogen-III synthase [Candidatus Hydrothermarchaeales archaeon]
MRIAITRPKERSEDTIRMVEDRGWEALIVPAVEIVPRSKDKIVADVRSLDLYDWLVLTSASGAAIMWDYFGDALKKIKIAVIGPKTKEVLERKGVAVALMPREYKAENLAEELIDLGIEGEDILVARASIGREVLIEKLKTVANVTEAPIYDTVPPEDTTGMKLLSPKLERGKVDAVIFTSSQSVKNLFDVVDPEHVRSSNALICAIGPITTKTLGEFGIKVDIIPKEYTVGAVLDMLEDYHGG